MASLAKVLVAKLDVKGVLTELITRAILIHSLIWNHTTPHTEGARVQMDYIGILGISPP